MDSLPALLQPRQRSNAPRVVSRPRPPVSAWTGGSPRNCHGCGSSNSITHAFSCHVGGLLSHAHDDIAMELILLMRRTAMKSHVRPEPAIHTRTGPHDFHSDDSKRPIATPLRSEVDGAHDDEWPENKKRGDIACRHLFRQGTTAIVDVQVKDLDSKTYRKKNPDKVLRAAELAKRRKYAEECREECKDFAPFIVSRDGLFGREAKNIMTRLAKTLHCKWNIPFCRTSFFVKSRMSLAILRSTTHVLYGERKIMEVRRVQPAFFHDNSALLGYWSTSRWS